MRINNPLRIALRQIYHAVFLYPYCSIIGPKNVAKRNYKRILGRKLNLDNPKDLNEKNNWLKFYSDTSIWSTLADKYKVREYVIRKGFENILVPLYGKWQTANEVDFSSLPNAFVLKTNHGSGEIIVVRDKSKINISKIRKQLSSYLREPYGVYEGEPHYHLIKPCIIAEKLLENTEEESYSFSVLDYKIYCFDGKPKYIWVCYNRKKGSCCQELYDLNWNYHPEKCIFSSHYQDGGGKVKKPVNLECMLNIAASLSEGFPMVRVDLYSIGNQIYFGEMTMTPGGGYQYFFTQDFLDELGSYCNI